MTKVTESLGRVAEKRTITGEQLKHLRVDIDTAPGSVLIRFKKAGEKP